MKNIYAFHMEYFDCGNGNNTILIRLDPIMIPTGTSGRFNADSYLVMFCKV
jgi:hypothetical protein